ncbi:sugar phosphate isomerase/epimerase family protein [Naasia lichenicola]|uniref:Inosose dehydratase n=1 Tax=Naasia lichenicola TaxID=2565933 RepID=A0A4S4FNV1_9MICO|nr:TIM barrel protein [Naasia lichenicola]THG30946.1 inosose dehydratase [Naasia lichenicola]
MTQLRIGLNPLPWTEQWTANLGMPARQILGLETSMRDLENSGIQGICADLPDGMELGSFVAATERHGFSAAPGFFGVPGVVDQAALDAARRKADQHARLGLTEVFLGPDLPPERFAHPGVGFDPDADRVARIADDFMAVADVFAAEGVWGLLHSHISSWIETDEEVRQVLDLSAGSALGFGPDTAQLGWAGSDPVAIIRDYADRVGGVHAKDFHAERAAAATAEGADYDTATVGLHVWTEPGRGEVDFAGVLAALPPSFAGWLIIEVDVPDLPNRTESTLFSLRHLRSL